MSATGTVLDEESRMGVESEVMVLGTGMELGEESCGRGRMTWERAVEVGVVPAVTGVKRGV